MTIKGIDVNLLPHITDTTPSRLPLMVLVILIIVLYILYQLFLVYWEARKVKQLEEYARIIRKGPPKASRRNTSNKETPQESSVNSAERQQLNRHTAKEFTDEEKEALKRFNAL